MELSEAIKKVRLKLCLSQEGLARELHVGFTSVNRWENNHTKPNQIARYALIELCKNRNISPELIELLIKTK
ncbi:helix-turn-helix transcriptional regulator [Neobacillus sp. OS1-2]|uniref:helix-turn-helix domain-containing protein n=1 Tax=Neobacillus sp. OS1-2 TaxID=3070680 RepID=UPI0027E179BC|nr:helix-turn-helix transcriptional regulator [Neobacillus sp. OS1-2]WML42006.1 helix-turn-helix transcriptional regulator [Neobacillus sp. OS1-2]